MQTHLYLHKENTDIPSFQYRGKYLLKHFDYDLSRSVGRKGEITSGVCGGEIRIVIDGFADAVLLTWLFDTDEIEKAHSSVYDIFLSRFSSKEWWRCSKSNTLVSRYQMEKVHFEQAACVGLEIGYTQRGNAYIQTKITLQVRKIKVGETTLENRWTINK